jgi:hypothetical protein
MFKVPASIIAVIIDLASEDDHSNDHDDGRECADD